MEVYLFGIEPKSFEAFKTDKVSVEVIKQKMKEFGMKKARVIVWHERDPSPDEWGIISI